MILGSVYARSLPVESKSNCSSEEVVEDVRKQVRPSSLLTHDCRRATNVILQPPRSLSVGGKIVGCYDNLCTQAIPLVRDCLKVEGN
ncbi:hypothetical protein J6590_035834 [Homalodisca vitripennis]|nr:hypothetical protein J6590_035834 [Homalodisca vitripennis]